MFQTTNQMLSGQFRRTYKPSVIVEVPSSALIPQHADSRQTKGAPRLVKSRNRPFISLITEMETKNCHVKSESHLDSEVWDSSSDANST
jgi:hypothetical protein